MNRLNRNYWRLGWILFTNTALVVLLLIAPIRARHDRELLYQAVRMAPPPFSYLHEFLDDPWGLVVVLTLLAGILAEMRRWIVSSILNLGPYVVWLLFALWARARVEENTPPYELFLGMVLFIIPLTTVVAVNLAFYAVALIRSYRSPKPDPGSK